jgi:hypothetical protein
MSDDSLLEPETPEPDKVEEIEELKVDREDPGWEGDEAFGLTPPD